MDLLSLVLTLRPTRPAALSPRLGRAAYAILLDRLGAADPALATALHAGDGPKPVTCSDLMGPREAGLVSPAATYTLRYTALTAPVAAVLSRAFVPGDILTFEGVDFAVAALDPPGSPWPGTDGYDTLAARYLLPSAPPPAGSWTLLLTSPAAFKSQGLTQALPLPSLVFGSLAARWNAFAPVALPEEDVRRYAQERVAISRFALHSVPGWDHGQGDRRGMRIGAIGRVTYSALNHDRYWLAVLALLAAFARYAGLGILTTMGMGQVRALTRRPIRVLD